jgi:uroporphyrinogen decarboxylase
VPEAPSEISSSGGGGAARAMTGSERMLAACRRQPTDRTPVWYMRQAGRSLAEYRALRSEHDILAMQRDPETAAHITLMPIQRLDVDAAVIYADIMLPLDIMGLDFWIEPQTGPMLDDPIRTAADVAKLQVRDSREFCGYVFDAISLVRKELDGKHAVVGFAGSPFTLACYMIEGRPTREYAKAKSLMFGQPALWHELVGKITDVTVDYLQAQVDAGAQVIQLFDSWVGALSAPMYQEFVKPYSSRIFDALRDAGVPSIHFGTGAAHLLRDLSEAGPDGVSVDWRVPIDEAWETIGDDKAIQGNLDPTVLLTDWETVQRHARDVLRRAGGRPGHIFNLGHGVLPETDPALLADLRALVHEETERA